MPQKNNPKSKETSAPLPEVYLNIDHLKPGEYLFHFVEEKKIIKTVPIDRKKDR